MTMTETKDGYVAVRISTDHGTRTISTKTKDKKKAEKIIKEAKVEQLEQAGKVARLQRSTISQIVIGKEVKNKQAVEMWLETLRLLNRSNTTITAYRTSVNAWMREMKAENLAPMAVTEKMIYNWINDPESTTKLTTRNMHLSALRDYFIFCCHRGLSLGNPAGMVEVNMNLLSHEQKETRKKQPFTDGEFNKVINFLTERKETGERYGFWILAMKIARNSVLRLGDICNLEWACFKDGMIVWTDKTNARVDIPMGKELEKVIGEIPKVSAKYCFPDERAIINSPQRSKLSVQFGRLCQAAGVEGHSFHDLRHTGITEFVRSGNSLEEARKLAGHRSQEMTKRYTH